MSAVADALQHPAVGIAVALGFLLLVVSGFGFTSVFGGVALLLYLAITAFVLWLFWRGVRALERIADAVEAQTFDWQSDD
ncbi:hypothetical protein SAMN04487948_101524 [Halogranum amylolyticum]|uniref:Uncharacterized protein n=1 Tax=Halogranum amylolyticum TaxID=660520 RepID=A0A1H8NFW6_9EURY|nr:hypothetical protein [Halogranum amylolyticum]SEO28504.1 hypothetical protein SAMN04487948_101524 [Halogranum amylolyticum]